MEAGGRGCEGQRSGWGDLRVGPAGFVVEGGGEHVVGTAASVGGMISMSDWRVEKVGGG